MFGSLGFQELLLIFVIALIVFGPKKLPEVGKMLGKALGEFKKASEDLKNTIEREVQVEELKSLTTITPAAGSVARPEPKPILVEPLVEPLSTAPAPPGEEPHSAE